MELKFLEIDFDYTNCCMVFRSWGEKKSKIQFLKNMNSNHGFASFSCFFSYFQMPTNLYIFRSPSCSVCVCFCW